MHRKEGKRMGRKKTEHGWDVEETRPAVRHRQSWDTAERGGSPEFISLSSES